jgi:hypothetical protein
MDVATALLLRRQWPPLLRGFSRMGRTPAACWLSACCWF